MSIRVRGGASVVNGGTVQASRHSRHTPQQGLTGGTGQPIKPVKAAAPSPTFQRFIIGCRLPSLNDLIAASKVMKGNWSKYAELKVMYESMIKADIRAAKVKPIAGPVRIHFTWQEPNAKRDPDNVRAGGTKFCLDSLVNLGILKTDAMSQVIGFTDTFLVDKERPGVLVAIEEVTP